MILQLFCAFIGSFSFALLFNVRRGHLISASAGGLLAWAVYLLVQDLCPGSVFVASLVSSAVVTVYAEIMARVHKAPATVYLVAGFIPLFPGSSLYTTMRYAVEADWALCLSQGIQTLLAAIGISMGMVCATTAVRILLRSHLALRRHRTPPPKNS